MNHADEEASGPTVSDDSAKKDPDRQNLPVRCEIRLKVLPLPRIPGVKANSMNATTKECAVVFSTHCLP